MEGKTVGAVAAGLVLFLLAVQSGVLLWAILAGIVIGSTVFFVSRDWKAASTTGVFVTVVISAFGIVSMLSPGWYKTLL